MHQRRRIILLFGAGIVLPSLLLGYLAFRGIQNDRALLEKERLEETRQAADRVLKAVDSEITAAETGLSKTAAALPRTPTVDTMAALKDLAAAVPLIEQIFCLQDLQDIRFPVATLLYVPDGRRRDEPPPFADAGVSARIRTAQQLEFRDRDYGRALAVYQQALARAGEASVKGTILNAIARVQRRSGLLRDALATYEKIVREHRETIIPEGMPLGPSASLEIGSLTRELGDSARSLQACVGLYRSLIRRDWELKRSEFEFFVGRAKNLIPEILAARPSGLDLEPAQKELRELGFEEAAARIRTDRMLAFEGAAVPALKARLMTAVGLQEANRRFLRVTLDTGDPPYLVSIQRPTGRTGGAPEQSWGIIIDAGKLKEDVLRAALRDQFPSGETAWAVRGRDGAALLSSEDPPGGPMTFRTNFASNFPDWTLEFHRRPSRLIKTFLLSRRGFYFFALLLLAGILVFGLVLTIRSVSHELELARLKSDFVSTVSHEFKSPLTSIRQLAEMLQSGRVPSEERRQKYYDVLLEQSERLALLTDNILSLAKIESGRAAFKFEGTDVTALLTEIVGSIQERVRHEGFAIELEVKGDLPSLTADRTALSQAITNLVDNAIKYSGESRRIAVSARRDGQAVVVAVQDFGVGIQKRDLDRVFERFFRGGDELTRTVKGSGLGLTLVKEIVEAHRGRVLVESEPGKGSVFSVRLPLPQMKGDLP